MINKSLTHIIVLSYLIAACTPGTNSPADQNSVQGTTTAFERHDTSLLVQKSMNLILRLVTLDSLPYAIEKPFFIVKPGPGVAPDTIISDDYHDLLGEDAFLSLVRDYELLPHTFFAVPPGTDRCALIDDEDRYGFYITDLITFQESNKASCEAEIYVVYRNRFDVPFGLLLEVVYNQNNQLMLRRARIMDCGA